MISARVAESIAILGATLEADGFLRRGVNYWYRQGGDLVQVVNVQRSRWGEQHYVNVSFWLMRLGTAKWPREQDCHVRMRCDDVCRSGHRLQSALDAESKMRVDVKRIVSRELLPFLRATTTSEGLAAKKRRALLKRVAVVVKAQRLLGVE